MGRDFTGGANSSYEENDGFFEGETRNGAALYPQQRHRVYDGS